LDEHLYYKLFMYYKLHVLVTDWRFFIIHSRDSDTCYCDCVFIFKLLHFFDACTARITNTGINIKEQRFLWFPTIGQRPFKNDANKALQQIHETDWYL
jgi:hypothetical protein